MEEVRGGFLRIGTEDDDVTEDDGDKDEIERKTKNTKLKTKMLRAGCRGVLGLGHQKNQSQSQALVRLYHERVVDHYNNPRNVGSFDKNDPTVGTGLVGAPACGDVMKLQIKVDDESGKIVDACFKTFGCGSAIASSSVVAETTSVVNSPIYLSVDITGNSKVSVYTSLGFHEEQGATEWVKGKQMEEVLSIKNTEIAKHLSLPPVKLHCSMLAEDAIKAAIKDYEAKRAKFDANAEAAPAEKAADA
ncbi:hypothetical protein HHK36_015559 [Tetracentron sinense]|uniref:NIF system FeS cluster assembly NifU N-terminal domain-containing protein n=1 Tax=Tetracentron sinense TaxID=13715 RepID=A0A835DDR8_TETSI|nr:hypothetical protein HHK36_015559 [Tetracentron sinense]